MYLQTSSAGPIEWITLSAGSRILIVYCPSYFRNLRRLRRFETALAVRSVTPSNKTNLQFFCTFLFSFSPSLFFFSFANVSFFPCTCTCPLLNVLLLPGWPTRGNRVFRETGKEPSTFVFEDNPIKEEKTSRPCPERYRVPFGLFAPSPAPFLSNIFNDITPRRDNETRLIGGTRSSVAYSVRWNNSAREKFIATLTHGACNFFAGLRKWHVSAWTRLGASVAFVSELKKIRQYFVERRMLMLKLWEWFVTFRERKLRERTYNGEYLEIRITFCETCKRKLVCSLVSYKLSWILWPFLLNTIGILLYDKFYCAINAEY